jgi:hypothetical protein
MCADTPRRKRTRDQFRLFNSTRNESKRSVLPFDLRMPAEDALS